MRHLRSLPHLLLVGLLFCSCGGPNGSGPVALYDASAIREDFFAMPWPADGRLRGEGAARTLDMTGFRNPGGVIGQYVTILESEPLGGYGTNAGIFFRFDGPIDPASLPPDAAASIAPAASVFVVDATPGSPTAGQRVPLRIGFKKEGNDYLGDNALVLLPAPGFPLRPRTTYAAIVTDSVRGVGGGPARPDEHFSVPTLSVSLGVEPWHIVCATVFTTSDPTAGMKALRDAVQATARPVLDDKTLVFVGLDRTRSYDQYEGSYTSPNFQQGDPPYLRTGGGITFTDGKAQVARSERLRFALTVPHDEMPPDGWPVVLYAHGTGGNYTSFIDDSSAWYAARVSDERDAEIARLAMISIDQPLHGPRDPTASNPNVTTYNLQNLAAARDTFRQGAADDFQLLRLVKSIDVPVAVGSGRPIKFDSSRIYFKGHSQGGTTGPLFLAYEPEVKAAVLSGAGANLIQSLSHKTMPLDIPQVVEAVVGEPVDEFHPLMSIIQTYLEPADPGNYARLFFREPPPGQAPKSIYQSLGFIDNYTPVVTIGALALAMGVQPANPEVAPLGEAGIFGVNGQAWADPPIFGNVAHGMATGVMCEYQVPSNPGGMPSYDGHFVVFRYAAAIRQSNRFLATHVRDGLPTLMP